MRISKAELNAIVSSVLTFDEKAKVYLYGSRVNDSLKGGDIDLLVESRHLVFTQKIDILIDIKTKIGDQKIDLKIVKSISDDSFARELKNSLVALN